METKKSAGDLLMLSRKDYGFPSDTEVYDAAGVHLKLGLWNGKLMPPFGQTFFDQVESYPLRDDDIIVCGYPKTGCHWTWEVLTMIFNRRAELSELGKTVAMLEIAPVELIDSLSSPRVLNTHNWYNNLPRQVAEKKTKLVMTIRNPSDVAVSLYNHHVNLDMYDYNGTFENWFNLYSGGEVEYGSYFDYYLNWEDALKQHPEQSILVVHYEDMKEDLPREIRKMSKFLGVELEDQLVEDIARASHFDAMKEKFSKTITMSAHLMRKGIVGDWKTWLNAAQNESIKKDMEKLKGSRFITRFTI